MPTAKKKQVKKKEKKVKAPKKGVGLLGNAMRSIAGRKKQLQKEESKY